jgi:hypothetical protein
MSKAAKIQSLRNPRVLLLLCLPIVLAGCEHPLATTPAPQQFAVVNKPQPCLLKTGVSDDPKAKDDSAAANKPKESNSLTLQLGDALLDVFKTFTDRH